MDYDNKERNVGMDQEKEQQKSQFNAGHNDEDFDGGHPRGSAEQGEERSNDKVHQSDEKQQKARFNAGHNDEDYDGGHPTGFIEEDEGQTDDENEGTGSFNSGGNDSDYDGGHPGEKFPSRK